MIIIKPGDVLHKIQLIRLLGEICDSSQLSQNLYFKGGTCASMLGYLDRFSVDLDFDIRENADKTSLRNEFHKIFSKLNLNIEFENDQILQFILKYNASKDKRNTLKVGISDLILKTNIYKSFYLPEVDRFFNCQTIETMFANKLVAPIDRFESHDKIAGRDIYDIHHFFLNSYTFRKEIIEERTKMKTDLFIIKLMKFIQSNITDKIINEDLNTLLPPGKFQKIRKILKQETLVLLENSIQTLAQ